MAQEVERVLGKDEVTGSNPVISSIKEHLVSVPYFFIFTFKKLRSAINIVYSI